MEDWHCHLDLFTHKVVKRHMIFASTKVVYMIMCDEEMMTSLCNMNYISLTHLAKDHVLSKIHII